MRFIRRVIISIVGGTLVLIGVALTVMPCPSTVIILAGLAVLAIEFAWARHWLHKARQYMPGRKREKPLGGV